MISEVRVVGIEKIKVRLANRYPKEIKHMLRRALNPLLSDIKYRTLTHGRPEYLNVDTGRLRSSVHIDTQEDERSIRGTIGTNVWYGKLWETGSATDEHGRMVTLGSRKERHWLTDPFYEMQGKILEKIRDELLKLAKKKWG